MLKRWRIRFVILIAFQINCVSSACNDAVEFCGTLVSHCADMFCQDCIHAGICDSTCGLCPVETTTTTVEATTTTSTTTEATTTTTTTTTITSTTTTTETTTTTTTTTTITSTATTTETTTETTTTETTITSTTSTSTTNSAEVGTSTTGDPTSINTSAKASASSTTTNATMNASASTSASASASLVTGGELLGGDERSHAGVSLWIGILVAVVVVVIVCFPFIIRFRKELKRRCLRCCGHGPAHHPREANLQKDELQGLDAVEKQNLSRKEVDDPYDAPLWTVSKAAVCVASTRYPKKRKTSNSECPKCECGKLFLDDTLFCRGCGKRMPEDPDEKVGRRLETVLASIRGEMNDKLSQAAREKKLEKAGEWVSALRRSATVEKPDPSPLPSGNWRLTQVRQRDAGDTLPTWAASRQNGPQEGTVSNVVSDSSTPRRMPAVVTELDSPIQPGAVTGLPSPQRPLFTDHGSNRTGAPEYSAMGFG